VPEQNRAPVVWAIGGGKGGVGKSIVSALIAFWLSRMGKATVLVDTDLGGANIHTLMKIKSPSRTLNDFIAKKYTTLDETCIDSGVDNLKLIIGAGEILSMANPKYAQKIKIMRAINRLNAEHVVLDLGAGNSFNTLDFFLMAEEKILLLTPQPTSIQNAYAFIRSTVYRRLNQLTNREPSIHALVQYAMNPKNELQMRTVKELYQVIEEVEGDEALKKLKQEVEKIKPIIITNMVREPNDKNAGNIVHLVAEKYLAVQSENLGVIPYERQIEKMVSEMIPLTKLSQSSEVFVSIHDIVSRILS
jgi:flagellar biosynthesis protein FlhG